MPSPVRVLFSLVLPFSALVIVPALVLGGRWPEIEGGSAVVGALLIAAGLAFLGWTNVLFVRYGHGTLAPWDPTQHLVVRGPYRHLRNPMLSGVGIALLGEAVAAQDRGLAIWATVFFLVNHVWFVAFEEPDLVRRLGAPYEVYRAAVPRWVPRIRPWSLDRR